MKLDEDLKREIIESAEYLLYKIEGVDELRNYVVELNKMINKINNIDMKYENLKENIIKKFELDIKEWSEISIKIENIASQYPFRNIDTIKQILTLIYQADKFDVDKAIASWRNWYKVSILTGE